MTENEQNIGKVNAPEETGEQDQVWATVFEINPDAILEVLHIIDSVTAPEPEPIDPQIIKDEADELYEP